MCLYATQKLIKCDALLVLQAKTSCMQERRFQLEPERII